MVDKEMVEYAEKRLPEFRSAYDKLTCCAKEMTLVYEDVFASSKTSCSVNFFSYILFYAFFYLFVGFTGRFS